MATILATITDYWQDNGYLTAIIPFSKFYVNYMPERLDFPFVVLSNVVYDNTYLTDGSYIENVSFELTIYTSTLEQGEAYASTIQEELTARRIGGEVFGMRCSGQQSLTEKTDRIYASVILEYKASANRSLLWA